MIAGEPVGTFEYGVKQYSIIRGSHDSKDTASVVCAFHKAGYLAQLDDEAELDGVRTGINAIRHQLSFFAVNLVIGGSFNDTEYNTTYLGQPGEHDVSIQYDMSW